MLAMRIIDLSYPISQDMPGFPGDPPVRFTVASTIVQTGYHVTEVCIGTHAGTHLDTPRHVLPDNCGVEKLSLDALIGWAEVLDMGVLPPESEITAADLDGFADRVSDGARVLLKTGWGKMWGQEGYFSSAPGLSEGAAAWLNARKVTLLGVEPSSVSGKSCKEVHKLLLSAGVVIVEGVANLDQITADRVFIAALPLNLVGLDGSPVRMVAIEGLSDE